MHDERLSLFKSLPQISPNQVAALARHLLDSWGLPDWSFSFDRGTRRLGACFPSEKRITLSAAFVRLNPGEPAEILDVLLHELAHALAWSQDGARGHGKVWKSWCQQLGCRPERLNSSSRIQLPAPPPRSRKRAPDGKLHRLASSPVYIHQIPERFFNPETDKYILVHEETGRILSVFQRKPRRPANQLILQGQPETLGKLRYMALNYSQRNQP